MKLSGISISVSDLERSIKFYTEVLGFKHFDTFKTGLGRQAFLIKDGMRISLFETQKIPNGKIFDMSFLSRNIEEDTKKMLEQGAKLKAMPGQGSVAKVAHLLDPDGVDIALVEWNEDFEEKDVTID